MWMELFLKVLDMSEVAGNVIVPVLAFRFLLRKAPKAFSYALWAVVLFRLLCPVSLEAPASILPVTKPPSERYTLTETPTPLPDSGDAYQAVAGDRDVEVTEIPADPDYETMVLRFFGQYLWAPGMAVMAGYALVSYWKLKRKLLTASPLRDNIWLADGIPSPFVLGLIRPKIYLPSDMDGEEQSWILLHEQYHIRRGDHIFKALAFLALAVHWFNPLVWVAFLLAGQDMEMSCDEAVIKKLGPQIRADYTASLLGLALGKRFPVGAPLAFGEGNTRERILNLARWRKPKNWVLVLCLVVCIVLGVTLVTNPPVSRHFDMDGRNVSDLNPEAIVTQIAQVNRLEDASEIKTNASNFEIHLTADFDWQESPAMAFFYTKNKTCYGGQLRLFQEEQSGFVTESGAKSPQDTQYLFQWYLEAIKYIPQKQIRSMVPEADCYIVTMVEEGTPRDYARSILYSQNGVEQIGEQNSWFIHLQILPMFDWVDGGYFSGGAEAIHLFYDRKPSTEESDLIPGTVYVPYRCVYMHPASSYFDAGGDSGCRYTIFNGSFGIEHRQGVLESELTGVPLLEDAGTDYGRAAIAVEKWEWQPFPFTAEQWADMHQFAISPMPNFLEACEEVLYQPISRDLFLMRVDGELWLVNMNVDGKGHAYLWSIYQLVPEAAMGSAQWEFVPADSSREPVFTFDFDMEYDEITAFCDAGLLTEFNYGEVSDHVLTIPAGESLHWAPTQNLPETGRVRISFSLVKEGEPTTFGTIYLSCHGPEPDDSRLFTANLVGTGLHLDASPDGPGAVISRVQP